MKNAIMFSVALALMLGACNNSPKSAWRNHGIDTNKIAKGDAYYQCAMHPDEISDTSDNCYVCDDKLVKHIKQ